MSSKYNVAIVGTSSVVGEAVLSLLAERDFPCGTLFALESDESDVGRVEFRDAYIQVRSIADFDFAQAHLAFFCAGEEISAEFVPLAVNAGCIVIDDSAQFRFEVDVPLVVSEVNAHALSDVHRRGIVANPNSCVTSMLVALKGIYDAVGIKRINVATYQAVSGTGKEGIDELAAQAMSIFNMKEIKTRTYPKQIAFNVLPVIGEILENGYTREEMKMQWEMRKILGDDSININATCARVPVFFGHSQAVHLETREKISVENALQLLKKSPNVRVMDGSKVSDFPSAVTEAAGTDIVYVGRVREDLSHPRGLDLWIVADNIRKGAALNSIQIAEILVKDYLS